MTAITPIIAGIAIIPLIACIIIIIVLLIVFIQRRPRGMFPLKGRAVEA